MRPATNKKMLPADYAIRNKRFRILLDADGGHIRFEDLKLIYGKNFMQLIKRLESYFTLRCMGIIGCKTLKCCRINRRKGELVVRRFGVYQVLAPRFGLTRFYVKSLIPHGDDFAGGVATVKWRAELRSNQTAIVKHLNEVVYADARVHVGAGGCILKLEAGFGKSFIAAKMIHLLGKKTAIVVHSISMIDQWRGVIAACYGDSLTVGYYYGAKKMDGDVVVLVINSAANEEFEVDAGLEAPPAKLTKSGKVSRKKTKRPTKIIPASEFWAQFGFIIWDEIHLYANETGGRALTRASATFMLGLSATPDENISGFDPAVWWGCGPIVDAMQLPGVEIEAVQFSAVVHKVRYRGSPKYTRKILNSVNGMVDTASTVNMICEDERRNRLVVKCVRECMKRQLYTFVFADRREYLSTLRDMLVAGLEAGQGVGGQGGQVVAGQGAGQGTADLGGAQVADLGVPDMPAVPAIEIVTTKQEFVRLVGGAKAADMQAAEAQSRVIFTTYAFFGVGRSIPKMTGCVLATSRKNKMRQYIGRILRRGSDLTTVRHIYDIVDFNLTMRNQWSTRRTYYVEKGFGVVTSDSSVDCEWDESAAAVEQVIKSMADAAAAVVEAAEALAAARLAEASAGLAAGMVDAALLKESALLEETAAS